MQALKSVRQRFIPSGEVLSLMEAFRRMTNECISIGLAQGASSLKRLSELSYRRLAGYHVPSYYKLCAISRGLGSSTSSTGGSSGVRSVRGGWTGISSPS